MSDMDRIEYMFQQIDGNMKQINEKMSVMSLEMKQMREENTKLKEQVARQENKIERLEREVRRKNIVIKGVSDDENENESEIEQKVCTVIQKIGVSVDNKVDIDGIRRIGKYATQGKRPILVKLTKESKGSEILRNAKNLRGTEIWINEDYPKSIREERRLLVPQLKEARNKGHRAYIRYNRLVINNEVYRSDDPGRKQGIEDGEEEKGSTGQKRTALERSPEGEDIGNQLRKIRTGRQKN